VVKNVLARLENIRITSPIPTDCSLVTTGMDEVYDASIDCQNVEWLPTRDSIVCQNNENTDVSKKVRSKCFADDLPRKNRTISSAEHIGSDTGLSTPIATPSSESLPLPELSSVSQEAQAYKIFIFCHLFGLDHPPVHEYIYYYLFRKCFGNESSQAVNESCDEFRILSWFVSTGMDMVKMMRDKN